jgi:hypothetical protein
VSASVHLLACLACVTPSLPGLLIPHTVRHRKVQGYLQDPGAARRVHTARGWLSCTATQGVGGRLGRVLVGDHHGELELRASTIARPGAVRARHAGHAGPTHTAERRYRYWRRRHIAAGPWRVGQCAPLPLPPLEASPGTSSRTSIGESASRRLPIHGGVTLTPPVAAASVRPKAGTSFSRRQRESDGTATRWQKQVRSPTLSTSWVAFGWVVGLETCGVGWKERAACVFKPSTALVLLNSQVAGAAQSPYPARSQRPDDRESAT